MGRLFAASSGILFGDLAGDSPAIVGTETAVVLVCVDSGSCFSEVSIGSIGAGVIVSTVGVDMGSFSWQLGNTAISKTSSSRLRVCAFL